MKNYNELQEEFKEWLHTNKDVQYLWDLNAKGQANYMYADMYAKGVAQKWSQLLIDNYGADAKVDELANDISKAYQKAYTESAYYSKSVQNTINSKAKIGMRAIEPQLDDERLENLFNKLIDPDTTDAMREHLMAEGAIETVTRTAVTDTIKANARIQSKAGLHAYVERDAGAGCCKWCADIAGKYEYGSQPRDFWAVHADCTCTFTYKPSRTARADYIHFETENGKMRKITE